MMESHSLPGSSWTIYPNVKGILVLPPSSSEIYCPLRIHKSRRISENKEKEKRKNIISYLKEDNGQWMGIYRFLQSDIHSGVHSQSGSQQTSHIQHNGDEWRWKEAISCPHKDTRKISHRTFTTFEQNRFGKMSNVKYC